MKVSISNNPRLSPQNGNRPPFPCLDASRSHRDSTWTPSEEQEHEHEQEIIVTPSLPRSRINLSSVSNYSSEYQQRSCRVPLSGFRQPPPPCLPPFPFVRIPYGSSPWGGRPMVNYCPAQSNQNYYRSVIFRPPHPHGEHEASLGRGFNRPPPGPPPPPLPYVVSPHSYHVGRPFIVPGPSRPLSPPHMPLPTRPPALTVLVVKQIDHYFSEENLETDHHLKSLMDDQGWVHVDEIVKFPRVRSLTHNITLILKSLIVRSKVVEVKDKCIRRKNGWEKWIKKSVDQASNNN
ncbi:la-related protein 1A-like [Impatiens glandulifera]|uniref:la-related protein 1A-like n=1 Tax=Impatiens glandulifera TaxID=253017 RepID=UPI001FB11D71|nr:la-related protein 1A-like [Impatiens glandulifera]